MTKRMSEWIERTKNRVMELEQRIQLQEIKNEEFERKISNLGLAQVKDHDRHTSRIDALRDYVSDVTKWVCCNAQTILETQEAELETIDDTLKKIKREIEALEKEIQKIARQLEVREEFDADILPTTPEVEDAKQETGEDSEQLPQAQQGGLRRLTYAGVKWPE
jgi:chromosome segregation ATPase